MMRETFGVYSAYIERYFPQAVNKWDCVILFARNCGL